MSLENKPKSYNQIKLRISFQNYSKKEYHSNFIGCPRRDQIKLRITNQTLKTESTLEQYKTKFLKFSPRNKKQTKT